MRSKFVEINHHIQKLSVASGYLQEAYDFITQHDVDAPLSNIERYTEVEDIEMQRERVKSLIGRLEEIRQNISSRDDE